MAQTVGNYGGVSVAISGGVFTATSSTDSGPLLWKQFPWGKFKNFQFQAVLPAASTLQIAAYGTMDPNTASGAATGSNAVWFMLPAPATEAAPAWANPMTISSPGLYVTALILCVRLLITTGSGAGSVLLGVAA